MSPSIHLYIPYHLHADYVFPIKKKSLKCMRDEVCHSKMQLKSR